MRSNWPVKPLSELCEIARGGSPRPIKEFLTDDPNGTNWIKISDATASSKYIYETKQKIKPEGIKRSRLVNEGDFLLSNSMSFGRPYIMRTSGCIHDGWLMLSNYSNSLDQDYLYYFLGSSEAYQQFDDKASGSTVRNLNIDLVKTVKVLVPPISVQKHIVAILDEAFAGIDTTIANTQKNLANARELFESYLQAVFTRKDDGWNIKTIKEMSNSSLGKMLDKNKNKGILRPYLRNLNVQWFSIDTSDILEMKIEDAEVERYGVKEGDLLICEGGYPGRAAIWESDDKIFFQKALHRVRCFDPVFNKWLLYFLYLAEANGSLKQYFTGAGIQHLTGQALKRIEVPCPPLNEVKALLERIDVLYRETQLLESNYRNKLDSLVELKQSLLKKAFSGELTANNVIPITSAIKPLKTDSPAFAAHIMAAVYHWHESQNRNKTFGRVKAQKTLHLVEALAGIDMGRNPIKDAAGPNDSQHMRAAEDWSKANAFFEFVQRANGRGYDFKKLSQYDNLISNALEAIEPYKEPLQKVVKLLLPLNKEEAEILTTVYAAWNNLLLDGVEATEEAIIYEARENWHPDKLRFARSRFRRAIQIIRSNGIVPTGTGKRVVGQESMF